MFPELEKLVATKAWIKKLDKVWFRAWKCMSQWEHLDHKQFYLVRYPYSFATYLYWFSR